MRKYTGIRTIIDKLKAVSTQEEKREILEYYSYESLLKRTLSYAYNPMITFDMEDWTPRNMGQDTGIGMSKFMHVLDDIFQLKFTQEEAEFACNMALMHMSDQEAPVFVGILKKDLGTDLELDTINSVWPDLVPGYPVQLASEYKPALANQFTFPCVAQQLSQGLRVNIIVRGNSVEFRTKDGIKLKNFGIYNEQFGNLAQQGATVFDGHAVVVDEDMHVIATDDDAVLSANPEDIRFILWDTIRYDGFAEGKDNRIGYNWRFNGLEHMMFLAVDKNPMPCYKAPEHKMVNNVEEAIAFAKDHDGNVVIKNLPGIWKNGYSTDELIIRS